MKAAGVEASRSRAVESEPTDPQDINLFRRFDDAIPGIDRCPDMVYRYHTSIPVWVAVVGGVIAGGVHHNIGVGTRIYRILTAAEVVRRVIDT